MRYRPYPQNWKTISQEVRNRDQKCMNCGSTVGLQTHHNIPLSRGGLNIQANLITLCVSCHNKKHIHLSRNNSNVYQRR
jgi:5-methylcytosine-specific restriction endonuclease McrA